MNIQSMTGYGRGEEGGFKVEVRSSNQRNLDIRSSLPSYLYCREPEIRKIVKERFHRGRIEIYVPKPDIDNIKLTINKSLAKEYYEALVSLKHELSISDDIGISLLSQQRDIFSIEEPDVGTQTFRAALEAALDELKKIRLQEGKNLVDDILKRLTLLGDHVGAVEKMHKASAAKIRSSLIEKIKNIIADEKIEIDESRIIHETAFLIERSDITEEIVRLKSHLGHVQNMLHGDSDVIGKKLEFFSQELLREMNTIGSKSTDAEISALIVEMKHELEKIREQALNIQ